MIDPDVRAGEPADSPQLDWLEHESRGNLAGQRGGDRWLETHPSRTGSWSTAIEHDHVFVAHIGEVAVGYLVLVVSSELAEVADVYVTPAARELGFGDALLAAGLDRARACGCSLLEGASLPGDRDTKNLYERAGIKARLITVSTPI
jgi:GNAT superfamily N-acetyltransferase